jgi:hypothetical protein
MALRKPLVVVNGQVQQLQAGDTIANPITVTQTNDEAGAIVIGTPVYNDAIDGVKKGQANAAPTSKILGLVADVTVATGQPANIQTSDIMVATTAQWDAVAGTTGGLAFGVDYYLDPATAGKLTSTATSTVGQYLVRIGRALSTTELDIRIDPTTILM